MTITVYEDKSSPDAPDWSPITAKYMAAVGLRRYLLTLGYTIDLSNDALMDHVIVLLEGDHDG